MADKTNISWTDATWNPIVGCSHVSPGCENCYAEALSLRRGWTPTPWTAFNATENVQLKPARLEQPFHWKAPRRVFVNSMSDLFHEQVPDAFIRQVFDVMLHARGRHHIYQILTKRPVRMLDILSQPWWTAIGKDWQSHIWLGVSVEDQRRADERIPVLLQTPASCHFLSCEPLLGKVDLRPEWLAPQSEGQWLNVVECGRGLINWVIVGGESAGPPERRLVTHLGNRNTGEIWTPTFDGLRWVRSLRHQCESAGVSFFFKQWGGPRPTSGGDLLDGQLHHAFPGASQ